MTKRIQSLRPRPEQAPPPLQDDVIAPTPHERLSHDPMQRWLVPVLLAVLALLMIWIGYSLTVFIQRELNPSVDLLPIVIAEANTVEAARAEELETIATQSGVPTRLQNWAQLVRAENLTFTSIGQRVFEAGTTDKAASVEQLTQAQTIFDELIAADSDPQITQRAMMGKALAFEGLAQPQEALTIYGRLIAADPQGVLGQQARRRAEFLGEEREPNDWWVKTSIQAFYDRWQDYTPPPAAPPTGTLPGMTPEGVSPEMTIPSRPGLEGSLPGLNLGGAGGMLPGRSPLTVPEGSESAEPGLELPPPAPAPMPSSSGEPSAETAPAASPETPAETPAPEAPTAETPATESPAAEAPAPSDPAPAAETPPGSSGN